MVATYFGGGQDEKRGVWGGGEWQEEYREKHNVKLCNWGWEAKMTAGTGSLREEELPSRKN